MSERWGRLRQDAGRGAAVRSRRALCGAVMLALIACGPGGTCGDGSRPSGGAASADADSPRGSAVAELPTPTSATTAAATAAPPATAWRPWRPPPGTTWQWQLDGPLACDDVVDGHCLPVTMFDVDLFETSTATVASLHAQGHVVICYLSVGSVEAWRPDAARFPAAAIGKRLQGWPRERWLDVRDPTVRAVLGERLDLAVARGCDGVEPDNVDGHATSTGFPLQVADGLDFVRFLIDAAHARQLSIGLKNAPGLLPALIDEIDWALSEECLAADECAAFAPLVQAGRAVFHVEYTDAACEPASLRAKVCADHRRQGFSTLIKEPALGPWGQSCPASTTAP